MVISNRRSAAGAAIRIVLAVILGALALGALGVPAHAADNGRWSVYPIKGKDNAITPRQYFILDATPGSSVKDIAVVKNKTKEPLILDLYTSDAYNTRIDGGFALNDQTAKNKDVGSWITFGKKQVTVPPAKVVTRKNGTKSTVSGTASIPFTINVPVGATPGDHSGGFVTADTNTVPASVGGQTGLRIRQANAVRVYVRVAGPINAQMIVSNVHFTTLKPRVFPFVGKQGSGDVEYTLINSGNARITPTGDLKLTGLLGQTITSVPLSIPEVLPGQSVVLHQAVDKMPALDRVQAKISLQSTAYPAVKPVGDTVRWSISWPFVILLIALIVAGALYWRHRRRKSEPQAAGSRRAGSSSPSAAPVP